MKYSVTVVNQSGASQKVALLFADPEDNSLFALVWLHKIISDEGVEVYCWDPGVLGLGWGWTPRPVDNNMIFTAGASPVTVNPWAVDADNAILLSWRGGNFCASSPYHDRYLNGLLGIKTDTSFTVSQSMTLNVALYLDKMPALIMQARPNSLYEFDVSRLSYYLLVTDIMPGTVIPRLQLPSRNKFCNASISGVTKIEFSPAIADLKYKLNRTLQFIAF
ncbi:hypothetical protein [Leclercia sp.]|uniref:hypothetical protein n=1 Tax=Leclercia sp. TaxID=1898428 RepID=UPI0028A07DBC|nr:hypothetical protein [Leclercia sp.]